jgi:[methyl-Co(III) methanol-specific corrinoid protein]:coenzyme M methyltransferase
MNPKQRVLSVLSNETPDKIPVTCFTQVGIVEAMEKLNCPWPDSHSDPAKMVKLGTSLNKLTGLETARIPFCLTIEAEAMGCKVEMGRINRQPSIRQAAFQSAGEVKISQDFVEKGRIPAVLEATKILKKEYPDLPAIVGITGPFTLTGHLIEIERLVKSMRLKPMDVEDVLDKVTDGCLMYAQEIEKAGADVIVVNDPSAAPELIDPLSFKSTIKPRLKFLTQGIRTKKVLHICGGSTPIISDMADSGFDAISIEDKVDIAKAKELVKGGGRSMMVAGRMMSTQSRTVKVAGNVSTAKTIFTGKPDEVKREAKKALEAGTDLLAPACGIAPGSPLANIKALVEARDEYYK